MERARDMMGLAAIEAARRKNPYIGVEPLTEEQKKLAAVVKTKPLTEEQKTFIATWAKDIKSVRTVDMVRTADFVYTSIASLNLPIGYTEPTENLCEYRTWNGSEWVTYNTAVSAGPVLGCACDYCMKARLYR